MGFKVFTKTTNSMALENFEGDLVGSKNLPTIS